MTTPKFHSYPNEWGMQLRYTGPDVDLKDGDLDMLAALKEHLKDRQGEVLSWKFDLAPIAKEKRFLGLNFVLLRLWQNGFVVRFAKQFYNYEDRPEYIKWYIWEDADEGSNLERGGPRAAHYIV